MNEERDWVVVTETNRNNEVIVWLGLFTGHKDKPFPLDLCRGFCTLRLSLRDFISQREDTDVLGFS